MSEEGSENKSDEEESEETGVPFVPAELGILSSILADNALFFAQTSALAEQVSKIGSFASQMLSTIPAPAMIELYDAVGGAAANMLSATETIQQVMGPALHINEVISAIQLPEISMPQIDPSIQLAVSGAVTSLQSAVSELNHIRTKVTGHEERLLALEGVVRELQDLVKSPELPEDLREKVKELLKSIQASDYIR